MSVIKYNKKKDLYYVNESSITNRLLNEGDCKGCQLTDKIFENLNIPNIDFTRANLSGTAFSGSKI